MVNLPRFYSNSASSTYEQCPLRWKYKYIDKYPDPPGLAAVIGTFTHSVLENLCKEPPTQRTVEQAKTISKNVWATTIRSKDFCSLDLDENARRNFKWKAWNAIEGLWLLEDPTMVDVETTEKRVTANLSGVPFIGYIDRLDRNVDGLVVTDYKTGRLPRLEDRTKAFGQVVLYAAAVEETLGERPTRSRLLYLGSEILEIDISESLLNEEKSRLAESWSRLNKDCNNGDFKPNTGPLCGWCSFVTKCDAGTKEVKLRVNKGRMREDAPARKLLGI
tara:strand:- start:593 stop:1420 length:828 start_codon:yes stop_codon:yes gene_type:complete